MVLHVLFFCPRISSGTLVSTLSSRTLVSSLSFPTSRSFTNRLIPCIFCSRVMLWFGIQDLFNLLHLTLLLLLSLLKYHTPIYVRVISLLTTLQSVTLGETLMLYPVWIHSKTIFWPFNFICREGEKEVIVSTPNPFCLNAKPFVLYMWQSGLVCMCTFFLTPPTISRGSPHISQISHWLILVAFGYSWTSTISQNGYNPTLLNG